MPEFLITTTFILFAGCGIWLGGTLFVNFCCLIGGDEFIPILLPFTLTLFFVILHKYTNYFLCKRYNKGLKLSAKQIISFSKLTSGSWDFFIAHHVSISAHTETDILWVLYQDENIIPKTFFDYIIIFFYWRYSIHQKNQVKAKQHQKEDYIKANYIAKLLEKDINEQFEKSNKELNKVLQENEVILERLQKEMEN